MNSRDGIILVYKNAGMTSHDVVDLIRRKFAFKKVGHAGTLDPMARGLLIILLGAFTKKSLKFSGYDKEYRAVLCLGLSTDTGDGEGKVISKKDVMAYDVDAGRIKDIFSSFRGRTRQVPPMYSAKKIGGKKLYELARKGMVVKREPREIFIESIKVLDVSLPRVTFHVKCSKGTYVRQLAHDIGERIGCGAHLVSLERTKIGPFSASEALPLERISGEKILYENILRPE